MSQCTWSHIASIFVTISQWYRSDLACEIDDNSIVGILEKLELSNSILASRWRKTSYLPRVPVLDSSRWPAAQWHLFSTIIRNTRYVYTTSAWGQQILQGLVLLIRGKQIEAKPNGSHFIDDIFILYRQWETVQVVELHLRVRGAYVHSTYF